MSRILIAEYNTTVSSFLRKQLKTAYNTVEISETSENTWKAVNSTEYDVLMINIVMPGIDGFVLAQKALQANPGLQVIFITGFAAVAMDTYNTPHYAPRPMTSQPFHLREAAQRVRFYLGEADLPFDQNGSYGYGHKTDLTQDNVIYAQFGTHG
jgi:two-component system cell cycle response regulator CpdR